MTIPSVLNFSKTPSKITDPAVWLIKKQKRDDVDQFMYIGSKCFLPLSLGHLIFSVVYLFDLSFWQPLATQLQIVKMELLLSMLQQWWQLVYILSFFSLLIFIRVQFSFFVIRYQNAPKRPGHVRHNEEQKNESIYRHSMPKTLFMYNTLPPCKSYLDFLFNRYGATDAYKTCRIQTRQPCFASSLNRAIS